MIVPRRSCLLSSKGERLFREVFHLIDLHIHPEIFKIFRSNEDTHILCMCVCACCYSSRYGHQPGLNPEVLEDKLCGGPSWPRRDEEGVSQEYIVL